MANAKFKVGDIIRISDENDMNYTQHSMWKVENIDEKGRYDLYSFRHQKIILASHMEAEILPRMESCIIDQCFDNKAFVEKYYRLVTETEWILYGKR